MSDISEEEKKAIEIIKNIPDEYELKMSEDISIATILNLIDKQQEEIKRLDKDCIVYRQKIKVLKEYEEKLQKENKELKDDRDFYREQCLSE